MIQGPYNVNPSKYLRYFQGLVVICICQYHFQKYLITFLGVVFVSLYALL